MGATSRPAKPLTSRRLMRMYAQLSKARLSAFVVGSAVMGFVMTGPPIDAVSLAAVASGTFLASASANTWNQLYEIKSDAKMSRTRARPLPSGRMSSRHATAFGVSTAAASAALLYAGCNPLTAALGMSNIFLYAGIYTPLKKKSPLNTVVGAVVGAIPPMMGWAAATGAALTPGALSAGALLFLWQMPHFYALAWRHRKDYAAGNYAMLSVTDPTGRSVGRESLVYTAGLAALPFATVAAGVTAPMFAVWTAPINAYALYSTVLFAREATDENAKRVFMWSLWYLPVCMALMMFHSSAWGAGDAKQAEGDENSGNAVSSARRALGTLCMHENAKTSAAVAESAPDAKVAAALRAVACPAVAVETHAVAAAVAASAKSDVSVSDSAAEEAAASVASASIGDETL